MHYTNILALAASLSTASATVIQGFNYGATQRDGTIKVQADFQSEFSTAKKLAGTSGAFTAARLYTTVQGGTTNTPISAIPAAIAEGTSILLGMWASSGQTQIDAEIAALKSAISTYGTKFTNLVTGLSVGSEDLYRVTPTSLMNDPNSVGAGPDQIVKYIKAVRSALAGTPLSGVLIGHVDTWTAWVNGSNNAVAAECDWVGMNTFPYFQTTTTNDIDSGASLFYEALDATKSAVGGKPVWITETGWPVGGKKSNLAVASTANAQKYYDAVGCKLFGVTNTFWYTLVDANTDPAQPQFGIVGTSLSSTPLFNLTCPAPTTSTSSSLKSSATGSSGSVLSTSSTPLTTEVAVSTLISTLVSGSFTRTISSVISRAVSTGASSTLITTGIVAPTGSPTTGNASNATVTSTRSTGGVGAFATGSFVGAVGAAFVAMAAL